MAERPGHLHTSKSFTRLESTQAKNPLSRSRASTLQGPMPTISDPLKITTTPEQEDSHADGDVFASKEDEEEEAEQTLNIPEGFEELPIEIRSLTERFLDSLSAKVHPSPPSADRLSDLFQDFYTRASAKINTHIATLSARLTSDTFKKTSASSRPGSIRSISGETGEQQMLSATEMADRKKARRLLEIKRISLEEAVERAVCEKVYDRIWRHRSTDDEERDHKLRSRTAALALVGIGLNELLMSAEELTEEERKKTKEREGEIREWLSSARDDILLMNEERYPLGKLRHLTNAHKSIVEALSKIFPASSSADEVLPTLIYTLITLEPSQLNAISDLRFIQRFRGSTRIDGETAYCLVNFEAAISFLETVDLSSLRAEESGSHEKAGSRPSTPRTEVTPMPLGLSQAPDLSQTPATPTSSSPAPQQPPSPGTKAQRRLSNLIQTQTNRIEAASDAVRESILDSADQALGRINNTLDTSFKFLFGRMKDRDPNSPVQEPVELPKTLEDARKLVSSPTRMEREDDNASVSGASSTHGEEHAEEQGRPDLQTRMTDLFGGRRQLRDRSVDSTQSGGSGKRVAFDAKSPWAPAKNETPPQTNTSAVDSIRNMGNSLNPLNRFANINVLPRFGRTVSQSSTPGTGTPNAEPSKQLPSAMTTNRSPSGEIVQVDDKGARAIAAIEGLKKTTPPLKKFLEAKDAQDLKLKEVDELLKEYQRLAMALRGTVNFLN